MRRFWRKLTGQRPADAAAARTEALHAGERPHDLDDPFFDGKVQARVADVIARAGQKK